MSTPLLASLKNLWFRLRRRDPEAIVVTFATGPAHLTAAMHAEARTLIPNRRHFLIEHDDSSQPSSTLALYLRLRRQFRRYRIGMAPVLLDPASPDAAPLRRAAFLLAPRKILAYNTRLERHHLQWFAQPISSLLFLRGTPLDRIHIRPWFWPFPTADRTSAPDTHRVIEGRATAAATRARIAVASPYFPWPLSHGGAVRLFYLLRESAREFDIDFYAFTERETEADFAELAKFCHRLFLVPKPRYREPEWSTLTPPQAAEYESPAMRRLLAANTAPLQVEFTQLAAYPGAILVEHDITEDLYAQIHARERTWKSWWNLYRWRRFERAAIARAQAVVVMSEKDAAALAGHPRAVVIANGVDLARFQPSPEPEKAAASPRVLFIGSFRHFPNRDAFLFLIEEVWPLVRARIPNAELTAVAGPDPELYWPNGSALPQAPGLTLHSYVADVKPLYDAAHLVAVPTLVSAGTNIKVLEAMAMQRAVVSTPSGCAGLGLVDRESVWVANDAAAFAEGIIALLNDPVRRQAIAQAARQLAERNFSWSELARRQRDLWRSFAPSPLVIRPGVESDLPAIEAIQQDAAHWPVRDYLSHQLWVAELPAANRPLAAFAVTRTTAPPDEHELLNLAVAPPFRRAGVALRLLEAALAPLTGSIHLEVRESNQPAILLYQKVGFYGSGRRPSYYQNPSEAGIVMTLRKC